MKDRYRCADCGSEDVRVATTTHVLCNPNTGEIEQDNRSIDEWDSDEQIICEACGEDSYAGSWELDSLGFSDDEYLFTFVWLARWFPDAASQWKTVRPAQRAAMVNHWISRGRDVEQRPDAYDQQTWHKALTFAEVSNE